MAYPYVKAFENRPESKPMSAAAIQTKLMPIMKQ
ncbi:hypothetical protein EDD76_11634 [Kineothrix alysoides]|uniref:Uncharacterized protein n=1 Tax=Kineothrix alysoides TaxID=1469948 RepID=A0A4R1QW04_9FIRM|nr:hypothetical protein EDD76_11634 [Kineothrix alysoides]